jgi:hypothetical protein
MEEPTPGVVGLEIETCAAHVWRHNDGIFEDFLHLEEVPMEVHRVDHHAVVHHPYPHVLIFLYSDGIGVRIGLPVDSPRRTHHSA